MKRGQKYEIDRPKPGVLTYRERGNEFSFPIYEEDGEVVFVAWPTQQRIFLWFLLGGGWTRVPRLLSADDHERISANVVNHLHLKGDRVRVMVRNDSKEQHLEFHPELFEYKGKASETLEEAGFVWLSHYSSVDLLHEEFGLEVCGIHEESDIEPIIRAMQSAFPQWHYHFVCFKDYGREPGWKFGLHMFPRRCGDGRCFDAD